MHLRIQEAKLGLTIPILHDTSQAATLLMYNGTLGRGASVKGIEKRNNKLEDKDTAEGRRYVVLSQPAQELRRSRESYLKKRGRLHSPTRGEAEKGGAVRSKTEVAQVNE
jgi:hypothetical protein